MQNTLILTSFAVFLLIFWTVGFLAARATKLTDHDYLIGDRSFGPWAIGLSAGATGNSGFIMVGAVGFGYLYGISTLLPAIGIVFGMWLSWRLYAKRVNQHAASLQALTIPGWLSQHFDRPDSLKLVSRFVALAFVVLVGAYALAQFLAASKTLNALFGWSNTIGVLIAAVTVLAYCVTGGLRASIWTDIFQAIVVMIVTVALLIYALFVAGGVNVVTSTLTSIDPNLTDLFGGQNLQAKLIEVIGFTVLGFGFNLSQPQIIVRMLASKSPEVAKKATNIYIFYIGLTYLTMTLFGVITRVLFTGLADAEQALPIFAMEYLNPVLIGIVIAGLFSTIASTLDSQILVTSSALFRDLIPNIYKKLYQLFGMYYWYAATLITGLLIALAAICFQGSVFTIIIVSGGILIGIVTPAILVVLHNWSSRTQTIILTMLVGTAIAAYWTLSGLGQHINESVPTLTGALLTFFILRYFENDTAKESKP
ncbi:MAG: sodium/proline symporter [Gammaproteobacteria bacterium]|nr:sodium/proline symporter [Gammaproteobacteria bacterium]